MSIKHAFTSAASASADPAKVDGPKWNSNHVIDAAGLDYPFGVSAPAAPAAGNVRVFGRDVGGRGMTTTVSDDGLVSSLQPHLGRNKIAFWLPSGNNSVVTVLGMPGPNSTGPTRNVATTNLFQSMRRIGLATSAAANSNSNTRSGAVQFFMGSSAGVGGFHYVCRFGTANAAAITDGRVFVGLSAAIAGMGAVNPSTSGNTMGIGYDGGDVNWAIISNDATGTATKVDLGVNFPCTTQSVDVYELVMYVPPNSTTVKWAVTRLNTGNYASGVMTTDVPPANTLMQPHFNLSSGASALAVNLDLMSLYIETDS